MDALAPKRVAIVGGGLSGLATACHLEVSSRDQGANIQCTIFESGSRLGGVIHSERFEHPTAGTLVLDHGADMFATKPSAAVDLLRRIGAEDRLITPKTEGRGAMIVHRGRLVPIPEGFVLMRATRLRSMATTPLLSVAGKIRLLSEYLVREPDDSADRDESVADFVTRRMGVETLERIVGPLVAGIYTADVRRLSMRATMKPILDMVREHGSLIAATLHRRRAGLDSAESNSSGARYEQFRAFKGGMIDLIETLQEFVPSDSIHLNHPITKIESPLGSDDRGSFLIHGPDGSVATFDEVVVASPAATTAKLIKNLCPIASENLCQIRSASTAIVVLVVKRKDVGMKRKTFGFVVPPIEERQILAGSFASEKFDDRSNEEHVIIRVFVGGMLQPEWLEHDDPKIIAMVRSELADLIGLGGSPEYSTVVRWNQAMPQYEVGHLDRVRRIRESVSECRGLHLVSNALDGVGISPIIGQAGRVAQKILSGPPVEPDACQA